MQIGPAWIGLTIARWMLNLTHPGWNAPEELPAARESAARPVHFHYGRHHGTDDLYSWEVLNEGCYHYPSSGKRLEYTSDPYGTDPAGSLGNEVR